MDYTLLNVSSLSAEAQRALGSGPGKMMAARGMAPLANPIDLLSVLYQLCMDVDPKLAGAARASAKALPAKILTGALAEVALDPRVIDFFIREADAATALVETVVLNKSTADETIARLAARADSRLASLADAESACRPVASTNEARSSTSFMPLRLVRDPDGSRAAPL